MTWILILSFFYQAPVMTWAGDFKTHADCIAAGEQWNAQNSRTFEFSYECIQAKRS